MSVWSKEHNPETSLKRNTFPQSFCNNLTFNFGKIVPFACFETMSGDTFELETSFGLRFWPTAFPLQSRIRADIHWFYVRSRNLYNEFKEYYTGGTVDKPMPYLSGMRPEDFKNSSLMDYFNVPTTINLSDGDVLTSYTTNAVTQPDSFRWVTIHEDGTPVLSDSRPVSGEKVTFNPYSRIDTAWVPLTNECFTPLGNATDPLAANFGRFIGLNYTNQIFANSFKIVGLRPLLGQLTGTGNLQRTCISPVVVLNFEYLGTRYTYPVSCGPLVSASKTPNSQSSVPNELNYSFSWNDVADVFGFEYGFQKDIVRVASLPLMVVGIYLCVVEGAAYGFNDVSELPLSIQEQASSSVSINLSDLPSDSNPFLNGNIPLNALPFRAYEQIYNAFFRDERNNPLIIDGKPYYDKYLPSLDGGADPTRYGLHVRNWEQDFLTTALPSPQQGEAPLVGISPTGVMTLADENGNTYQAQAITADDNDTIIGAKFIATNQDGTSVPNNVARSLVSYATSGISINDFRNVNALQRYLETNLRRGLKYRDLVAARWGVNISYSEMNMPEFIGGATEYVVPSQVTQTSQDTSDSPLGSYAGQLHCQGAQKHKIRHFCDEEGFIIGVVSVVPVPIYSQLLPKMFTKFDRLDYFQPEFGHIGLQPIPMREVAPLQIQFNGGSFDETFGYQRAWYDYLGRVDEVHGDMRGSLRDYVMYRTFSGVPRLGTDFLLVDNKPLDSVFMVQKDADGNTVDKILGQIYVDAVTRRPIPRYGVPRLE